MSIIVLFDSINVPFKPLITNMTFYALFIILALQLLHIHFQFHILLHTFDHFFHRNIKLRIIESQPMMRSLQCLSLEILRNQM